jgi:integrase
MLNLYREHTKSCTQKRRARQHSRKAEEAPSLGWKKCGCPIYASGTLKDGFQRKKTGYTTWAEAEAQATKWEQAGSWSGRVPSVAPITPAESDPGKTSSGTTIEEAVKAFLAKCERRGIQGPTYRKYKTFTKQFRTYCDGKGYLSPGQLQVGDGELFYATWNDGARAAGRKLERFRRMVKFWKKQGWIEQDLGVFDIDTPIGANEPADQFPYTDDELEMLYKACDRVGEVKWKNHLGTHSWHGRDVKDFMVLSIFTGLRISDVSTFDVSKRLDGNDIFIRAMKNGKRLYTWVPDWVRDILVDRQKRFGAKIFKVGESDVLHTVTAGWRTKLNHIFDEAQKEKKLEHKPKPHRFRHTFIRILLEHGVPVEDVALLAGDSVDVIVKYYSKWMPERQERLRNRLQDAFSDKPKLLVLSKRQSA